jgi:activating signal cointegrator 1
VDRTERVPMRALTLAQPWATLVALGVKRYEDRAFTTGHRGPVVIHAGPTLDPTAFCELPARAQQRLLRAGRLPTNAVVCVALLEDVFAGPTALDLDRGQLGLGDFSDGRYAWRLAHVRPVTVLGVRGGLGLWRFT